MVPMTTNALELGFFIKNRDISVKSITEITPGRILLVELEYFGFLFRCINIYVAADEKLRRENFENLKFFFLLGEKPLILGGDFNCIWPGEKREKKAHGLKTDYSAINLKKLVEDIKLIDAWKI